MPATLKTTTTSTPVLTWGINNDGDQDGDVTFEWECFCDEFSVLLNKINPSGKWHVTVENFGWQSLSGCENIEAIDAKSFLSKMLPRTECSFKVFVEGKGFGRYLKIQNFHHDSPVGNEWYTAVRFNARVHPAN